MTKHRDGGPAFPYGQPNVTVVFSEGMSLRDYFAAAALSRLFSNKEGYDRGYAFASEQAYHYADEMLIARKQYP